MAYTPPAGDSIVFEFGTTGAYTPPPGDEIVFNFLPPGTTERAPLGVSYAVNVGDYERAPFGSTYTTAAAEFERVPLGLAWATAGVKSEAAPFGTSYVTDIFETERGPFGSAYSTRTFTVEIYGLGVYWGYMAEITREWEIVSGEEVSREWDLPSRLIGEEISREFILDAGYGGVSREWDIDSTMATEVSKEWDLPSQHLTEVSREWDIESPLETFDVVSKEWTLPSPMIDDAEIIATPPGFAALNGRDIELLSIEVSADEGQFGWKCGMQLAHLEDYDLFQAETRYTVTIGGEVYAMVLDSKQKPRSGPVAKAANISGISPCARYNEPRARLITKTWTVPVLASALAVELFPEESIAWTVIDWSIPSPRLSASNESPRGIMQRVLAAAGAVLECEKDGSLKVRYLYPVSVPAYAGATPDQIFTDSDHNFTIDEGIQLASLVNKIRIMDVATFGFQDRMEFVPDAFDPSRGTLKVWPSPWRLTFEVAHTSLPIVSVALIGVQTEQLTEVVEVVNGKGSVSHPAYSIDSFTWMYDDLGGIVADVDATEFAATSEDLFESLVSITYTTRFVAYDAVAYPGAKVQFVTREPESA